MRYIFFFSLLILTACGKNEFTFQFNLATDVTENYNVTYFATNSKGGLTIQAVASVREGKCELTGVTRLPTISYITTRNSKLPLVIYSKKGEKILLTGEGRDPLGWKVEGNDINLQLSEWRSENIDFLTRNETDSINRAVASFVEENYENPVSTLLMLCYYNRNKDERGYADLMGQLRGEAKNPEWLKVIGRSDQIYHYYYYPARLESMVMRSDKEGADTLKINYKNPTLLMFWQTGYDERKDLIDTLKILEKELPDSALLIADLCLDADSLAWKNAIKRDSLKHVKRFWVPMGMTDPTMMKLRVPALPYFIVFDKEGNQDYRGGELSEAIGEYRKLYNMKDSVTTSKP